MKSEKRFRMTRRVQAYYGGVVICDFCLKPIKLNQHTVSRQAGYRCPNKHYHIACWEDVYFDGDRTGNNVDLTFVGKAWTVSESVVASIQKYGCPDMAFDILEEASR